MLFCLLHPAIIGGNDQKSAINTTQTGDYIADEVFVPGDINNTYHLPGGYLKPGKTEVNGHAAPFLFG